MRLFGTGGLVAVVVVVVAAVVVQETRAARILVLAPIGSKSHKNFYMAVAETLAQRNHTITFVTGSESTRRRPNIREVFVPDSDYFSSMPNPFNATLVSISNKFLEELPIWCTNALSTKEVQKLFDEQFDLVMVPAGITDCFLTFVHKLKVPLIYLSPNVVQGAYGDLAGTPSFPSLQASFVLDVSYPLTFLGRMVSTLTDTSSLVLTYWYSNPRMEELCRVRKLCPDDMPSLAELRLNSSLFITNSVRTMESPTMPYTPTVVHAGGIHCRPAKPLPEDLQEWVAGAGDAGFILFSLGSVVRGSLMPEEHRRILLEVFGALQQRVLWKWDEDTMEGLPPNVRLAKWLPQQDILGHPQLRLFITHGGLLSTQEATYHGVPVLGMPVYMDQRYNMRAVQREGWGRVLHWEDLTREALRHHVLQILEEPGVREEAQRRSRVMRDQPVPPGEWAAYWVEYVLRHQGAAHLRSHALHLPWYELYNVDVWATVVVVTVAVVGLAAFLCCRTLRALLACCRAPGRQKQD